MSNTKFQFALSVSVDNGFQSKDEAKWAQNFTRQEFASDETTRLHELFTQHNISGSLWSQSRKEEYFQKLTAIVLDYDEGFSIQQARDQFAAYHSLIYTSTSHRKDIEGKGGIQDRFRVILPIDPDRIDFYSDVNYIKDRVYPMFHETFEQTGDEAVWDLAHMFYPNMDGQNFEMYINDSGDKYINQDISPVVTFFDAQATREGAPTFTLETKIQTKDGVIATAHAIAAHIQSNDAIHKMSILCPVCGDKKEVRGNPGEHNAVLFLKASGEPLIHCSSCDARGDGANGAGNYFLERNEAYDYVSDTQDVYFFLASKQNQYYAVYRDKATGEMDFFQRNLTTMRNTSKRFDIPIPDPLPEYKLIWDFTSDTIVDKEKETVNQYIAPDRLKQPVSDQPPTQPPEYIGKLVSQICGHGEKVMERFYNHLAYKIQTRKKSRVTFLFRGTQGTGKGFFFANVMAPIFGERYVIQKDQRAFEKEFNTFLEDKTAILVNEINLDYSKRRDTGEIIKTVISDAENMSIEAKGIDARRGAVNADIYFATNEKLAVRLEEGDRRWNVCPWQPTSVFATAWWPGGEKLEALVADELEDFVDFLKGYDVKDYDFPVAKNEARAMLIEHSKTNTAAFFDAVKAGDLEWLYENIRVRHIYTGEEEYNTCWKILFDLAGWDRIKNEQMLTLYNNIFDKNDSARQFNTKRENHGLISGDQMKKMRFPDGTTVLGYQVQWQPIEIPEPAEDVAL